MTSKEYSLRRYKDGDEEEIVRLLNDIFGENLTLEGWIWKHKENPLSYLNLAILAEHKGRIIGQYAGLPVLFKFKDKIVKFGMVVDNFVHPDFRGGVQGIQRKMFEYSCKLWERESMPMGWGLPNRQHYIVGKRILKYKDVGKIPFLFRRLNWNLAVKKRFLWLPQSMIQANQYLSSMYFKLLIGARHGNTVAKVKVRKVHSFDERVTVLWNKVKDQYEIIAVRDQTYLNWRYKKPGNNYQIIVGEKGDEIVGYIVIDVKKTDGQTVGYIVDFLSLRDHNIECALIKAALLASIAKKVDYVLCWMLPNKGAYAALRKFGFAERKDFSSTNVVYHIFNPTEIDEVLLKDTKNWYLTLADSDIF